MHILQHLQPVGLHGPEADLIAHFVGPFILASSFAYLMLTKTQLPSWTTSWVSDMCAKISWFGPEKKNQFFLGEINFNYVAILVSFAPAMGFFWGFVSTHVINWTYEGKTGWDTLASVSIYFGLASLVSLAVFLIPVTRHSVLVAAMGWSPVHAIRLHIVSGYFAFWFAMFHGILYIPVWFHEKDDHGPVIRQIVPEKICWNWKEKSSMTEEQDQECHYQWFGFTGVIAGVAFFALTVSSLNYFRRRMYQTFYWIHVALGPLTIMLMVWHWAPAVIFLLPSTAYYLASTTPVLVQALASRFRGGHKIVKVRKIQDASGVVEIAIAVTPGAAQVLLNEGCPYVKVCVPKISLIWHPLSAFQHPQDRATARILMRPVGRWSKAFQQALLASDESPTTILDGIYGGVNHVGHAIRHDHVTIIAGGVTIPPYLSLIPKLISCIEQKSDGVATNKIIFHWACREFGLMKYVKANYLDCFVNHARKLSGLDFEIHIYYTGKSPMEDVRESLAESQASTKGDIFYDSAESGEHVSDEYGSKGGSNPEIEPVIETDNVNGANQARGFAMELARLHPTRHDSHWRSLPAFFAFSGLLWFGFYMTFSWYYTRTRDDSPDNKAETNTAYVRLWGLCINLLVAVGFSLLMEFAVVHAGKYWPQPRFDDYEIVSVGGDEKSAATMETASLDSAFFFHAGRPTAHHLFEGARSASAPGIFVCAPVPLTEAVKEEARKENQAFLLKTRYCIYEEPFEF